jgi:hypothetical protein
LVPFFLPPTYFGLALLKVGQAEIVRNEVVSVGDAELIPINVGDDLVRDATIRTSANSDAKFGLIDNTKLTLGPGSTLMIAQFIQTIHTTNRSRSG